MPSSTTYITTTGAGTYTVPVGIYRISLIEVIGGGGGGSAFSGGGGAAYSAIANLFVTPGHVYNFSVGSGGVAGGGPAPATNDGGAGGDSWFGASSLGASLVGAKGGAGGVYNINGGAGGLASSGVGTVKQSGGGGGNWVFTNGGAGGGGAGGPNGDGKAGGNTGPGGPAQIGPGAGGGGSDGGTAGQNGPDTNLSSLGGNGGNNFAGTGGGSGLGGTAGTVGGGGGGGEQTGTAGMPGGAGGNGITIGDGTKGSGGGGGGASLDYVFHVAANGGAGGLYGGGGGGGSIWTGTGVGGVGGGGIIAITYEDPQSIIALDPGHMTWVGGTPTVTTVTTVEPGTGALTWTGGTPTVVSPATVVRIPSGHLHWTGLAPQPFNVLPPAFDWRATVISQYQTSPIILRLVENMYGYVEPGPDFDAFFNLMWNVNTAQGYGLDVWGRIVGVGRVLNVSTGDMAFGWEEGGTTDYTGFGQAPFFGGGAITSNFALNDVNYRRLILAKAAANITDGSIPAINHILQSLFPGRGNCYVTDGNDMTMTYTFEFALSPVEEAIVGQSGVLPKPVGVSVSVVTPP